MSEFYHIIYLFLIALLNSIDNIGIGVAYSIAGKKIPFIKNLLIATMAFLVSYISSLSGNLISSFLNEETCSILNMLVLGFMGSRMIYQSLKKIEDDAYKKYNIIGNKEAITVGILLALDDVGSSVSSGLIGYGALMVSLPFFIISLSIFSLANLGTRLTSRLNTGRKATAIAGILMIIMGILSLFR